MVEGRTDGEMRKGSDGRKGRMAKGRIEGRIKSQWKEVKKDWKRWIVRWMVVRRMRWRERYVDGSDGRIGQRGKQIK